MRSHYTSLSGSIEPEADDQEMKKRRVDLKPALIEIGLPRFLLASSARAETYVLPATWV